MGKKKFVVKKGKENPCGSEYHTLYSSGMHEIFINSLEVGDYSYTEWNDQTYLVVPVTIIVEGVHNGFFYPAEHLKESVKEWEGVLVPIYHPENAKGEFLSASEVESECVGRFWNSKWDEIKKGIVGEFWLIKSKLTEEVIDELIRGDMEVSTGLYASHDFEKSGAWNGETYVATLNDYEPDHVALLPGVLGACSWEDGCGVRANKKEDKEVNNKYTEIKKEVPINEMFDKLKGLVAEIMLLANASKEDLEAYKGKYEKALEDSVTNKLSYEDLRYTLHMILHENFKTPNEEYPDVYIRDTFDGYFVFERAGKMYSQNYIVDSEDKVTLGNDVNEVRLKTEYVTVNENEDASTNDSEEEVVDDGVSAEDVPQTDKEQETIINEEEVSMNKEELILALISNEASPFDEEDKDFLMKKDEGVIQGLIDKYTETNDDGQDADSVDDNTEDVIDNDTDEDQTPKKISVDEYLSQTEMPDEVRNALSDSVELYKSKHTALVNKIMANEKNVFTKEQLNKKDVKELSCIVALMGQPVKNDDNDNEDDFDIEDFSGNLSGFINRTAELSNERQADGTGVPEVMTPKWNEDGTVNRSQFVN